MRGSQQRYALPAEVLRQRTEMARSGKAGVHADQQSKHRPAAGRVNRTGSRAARRRAAVDDQDA